MITHPPMPYRQIKEIQGQLAMKDILEEMRSQKIFSSWRGE